MTAEYETLPLFGLRNPYWFIDDHISAREPLRFLALPQLPADSDGRCDRKGQCPRFPHPSCVNSNMAQLRRLNSVNRRGPDRQRSCCTQRRVSSEWYSLPEGNGFSAKGYRHCWPGV